MNLLRACAYALIIALAFSPSSASAWFGNRVVHAVSHPAQVVAKVVKTIAQTAVTPVAPIGNAVVAVAAAPIKTTVAIAGIMVGKTSLKQGADYAIQSDGVAIASVGQAVAATNAAANGVQIVAAQSIGGNVGKTTLTLVTGPQRLEVDFASTAAIEVGEIAQGGPIADLEGYPLAAALRSALFQFQPQSQPIPPDVKAALANTGAYPQAVLDNARWTVGGISLSVPDVIDTAEKAFGDDFAVTVGNITIFNVDPGTQFPAAGSQIYKYHWWAHEMWHQVQYSELGIDAFARRYVTDCHGVESEAENKAALLFKTGFTPLRC